ncbi:reverse transcriptase domain-containing protein [Tanacetum coccineum]
MKLNPKKCTFGVEEGAFLGHVVSMQGIKACPEKAEAVMKLQSSQMLKEAQSLNGKLASLNRFLSKSTKKSLPFFKTLKSGTTNGNRIKTQRGADNVSLRSQGSGKRGPSDEKGLTASASLFRQSCLANPRSQLQFNGKTSFSVSARHEEAEEILLGTPGADFIAERPDEEGPSMEVQAEEAIPEPWTLFTDGLSCLEGSGAGLILTNPEGEEFTYALRFEFDASNNKAKYEALVAGLRIAEQIGVKNLAAKVDSRLVANQINGLYEAKEQSMAKYLEKTKTLINNFKIFSIEQVPLVTDIAQKDKNEAKRTKPGTRMERVQEIEAKGKFIQNPIPLNLYPKRNPKTIASLVRIFQISHEEGQNGTKMNTRWKEYEKLNPKCMYTRNSYYPNNSPVTIPRRQNRRRAPNIVKLELRTIVEIAPMADNRTMEELLQAPTKGYGEAIVIPEILAENFEIKSNLLQLVQANKFHSFERDNPHTHIANFKRMTVTLKYKDVLNDVIKLMLFPYSLEGGARIWYEKEPPNSILTWDDLVNKFVNQFFPPSKTIHLKNEISHFTQKFDETFSEAWERFKEMLRACPHHRFTELTQIDTFYNGLNENDQDSLNVAAGGNLLSKTTREALNIIENKSKVRYSQNKSNVSRVNTTSRESSSKTDDRIDKLADQISNLVEIVNKKVVTPKVGNPKANHWPMMRGRKSRVKIYCLENNQD